MSRTTHGANSNVQDGCKFGHSIPLIQQKTLTAVCSPGELSEGLRLSAGESKGGVGVQRLVLSLNANPTDIN